MQTWIDVSKKWVLTGLVFISLGIASSSEAQYRGRSGVASASAAQIPAGQRDLIHALERRRNLHFVEVSGVRVVRLLPDDNQGKRHQHWVFELATGDQVEAVYNISMSERVPVRVGDVIDLAGHYIWEADGGLIHWLHEDPRGHRPDGYVDHNGTRYGEVD